MPTLPVLTLASVLGLLPVAAAQPAGPAGRWRTGPDGGVVEIVRCGGGFCGWIVGITLDQPGAAMPLDSQGRPQCGLAIIRGAARTGADEWTGQILDPRDGKTYHVRLSVDPEGRLKVRGYVGLPLFGETVIWTPFAGQIGANCRIGAPETREAGPIGD